MLKCVGGARVLQRFCVCEDSSESVGDASSTHATACSRTTTCKLSGPFGRLVWSAGVAVRVSKVNSSFSCRDTRCKRTQHKCGSKLGAPRTRTLHDVDSHLAGMTGRGRLGVPMCACVCTSVVCVCNARVFMCWKGALGVHNWLLCDLTAVPTILSESVASVNGHPLVFKHQWVSMDGNCVVISVTNISPCGLPS